MTATDTHRTRNAAINDYVTSLFVHEDEALRAARTSPAAHDMPDIGVQPFEGHLLTLLVQMTGARRVVEIGTLAGYSTLWLARALPADGALFSVEASAKHARVARENIERAGLAVPVTVLEGRGDQVLPALADEGPFDMVFIDADKASNEAYLAWAVAHTRPGGLIAAHNALRDGRIVAPQSDDDRAMMAFNEVVAQHPLLDATILTDGDGLLVAVRRPQD